MLRSAKLDPASRLGHGKIKLERMVGGQEPSPGNPVIAYGLRICEQMAVGHTALHIINPLIEDVATLGPGYSTKFYLSTKIVIRTNIVVTESTFLTYINNRYWWTTYLGKINISQALQ